MWNGKRIGVIIPAAGIGRRMGGVRSKQFVEIAGAPIILHTLRRFQEAVEVDEIVVASSKDAITEVKELVAGHRLAKVREVVPGGIERQDSVWNALRMMAPPDIVLIHDAVRPFVTAAMISAIVAAAAEHGAAIPALAIEDTIKKTDGSDFVSDTVDRTSLRRIQTPQGFIFKTLMSAFEKAREDHAIYTDESGMVEKAGIRVKLVPGDPENIKITTPQDLRLAEVIAQART